MAATTRFYIETRVCGSVWAYLRFRMTSKTARLVLVCNRLHQYDAARTCPANLLMLFVLGSGCQRGSQFGMRVVFDIASNIALPPGPVALLAAPYDCLSWAEGSMEIGRWSLPES